MNYIDIYKRRVSHLGTNYQEHAYNSGILEFRRYLKYSQHTEHNLTINSLNDTFSGVILTDKEDENRVSQILLVKVVEDGGPELKQGDLLWKEDDKNPWIIYRTTTSSYQPHQKFYIVRCNHQINWLDSDGMLCTSWVYLLGSKDTKIKDNFRTWHSVITPQPNKFINIIMPYQLINLGTEIMVINEVWYLVDYDQNSVPGIMYASFTETNFNEQRDSLENKIANIDQLATWEINMQDNRIVEPNSIFELNYTILKNGVAQTNIKPNITIEGNLEMLENNQIQAGPTGAGSITIEYKTIKKTQYIAVGATPSVQVSFVGDTKIRVASSNIYKLNNAEPDQVSFSIEDPESLVHIKCDGNICTVVANDKNKLGSFTLFASYKEQKFSKIISVVSLWQVI